MTLTRSKTGATPKKPEHPGYVETPGTKGRRRKSAAPDGALNGTIQTDPVVVIPNVATETKTASTRRSRPRKSGLSNELKQDVTGEVVVFEFGGSVGVTAMMIGFPLLMYYMWIGATYYDGKFPMRTGNQTALEFLQHLGHLVYVGAYPNLKAWAIYWTFLIVEVVFYLYMPGVYSEGKPLDHLGGQRLQYYCSGVASFYTTILLAIGLHFSGVFPLYTLLDEMGPIMSVAIISGFIVSIVAYVSALARGAEHRMSGYPIYDFFMGAELNPRMFTWLDFKMFFEVRLPWFMLFFISLAGAARQWDQYGYVSGEMAFLLMAHWLYANACCKAEELIPPTWDMYYEKWGFMLIFWNMAGVPLSYCHCTIYLANHSPETYRWPRWFLAFLYISYLFAYLVWDNCGSQKNNFRRKQLGIGVSERWTFPQLPWRHIENPRTVPVPGGYDLFADGWYKYARKAHYTCDMYFALCWGLITGFGSPFPWFYPVFFLAMITHRASRDIQRCRERYGKAWEEYERICPWLLIPYVY